MTQKTILVEASLFFFFNLVRLQTSKLNLFCSLRIEYALLLLIIILAML